MMTPKALPTKTQTCMIVATAVAVAILGGTVGLASGSAFPTYADGCDQCHGGFDDPTSPKGTVFPSDSKHEMHRATSSMNAECTLCHINPGDSPFTFMSGGTANNPGVGCTGCHGRDYGGVIGNTAAGLRAHHTANNVEICAACHPDDPEPLPESVAPIYYGTPDSNVADPCNESGLENWSIGDLLGLDNDGNNAYDQADADCGCPTDLDGSGATDSSDLAQLLGAWGPNPGNPADLDGNDIVDSADLAQLLGGWGPC